MIVFKNSLYSFALIEKYNILRFDWTEKTATMTYEDFQEACQNYAGFVIENKSLKLLVDTRNFKTQLPDAYLEWREKELNPRYYKVGVEKFAYLIPTESMKFVDIFPIEGVFQTCYFDDKTEAIAWLNQ